MENQNILRIVLSLAILAAFFLPLNSEVNLGANLSAWGMLSESIKSMGKKDFPTSLLVINICLLVVFVCVIIILITSVLRKETPVLLNLIPFIAIIALIIFNVVKSQENVSEMFQSFGTGFYIMFLASFLLPFSSIATTKPTAM